MGKIEGEYKDFSAIMEKARARVITMDDIDKKLGFASPQDHTSYTLPPGLRTVQSAIECGITTGEWGNIEEAYVMLEQIIEKMSKIKELERKKEN